MRDIQKLQQFANSEKQSISALEISYEDITDFIQLLNELGMSAYSQARIVSGVKSFIKYLLFEGIIKMDPTQLIESPQIGRK